MESLEQLPQQLLQRLERQVPSELWLAFRESLHWPRRVALRINTLKSPGLDPRAVGEESIRSQPMTSHQGLRLGQSTPERAESIAAPAALPTGWENSGRTVAWSAVARTWDPEQRAEVTRYPGLTLGLGYLQSLSSQLAAMVLDPQPGEEILDLAAAPGGKATHLAALMQNQGRLACVEPIRSRFFRLQANLKNMGVTVAQLYMTDGRSVGKKVGSRFDRVMLDAPCSGEARITSADPESYRTWSPRKLRETTRKQQGLIVSAWQALKPGGRLLYSTCSYAVEENEAIVEHLLEQTAGAAQVLPIRLHGRPLHEWGVPTWHCRREETQRQSSAAGDWVRIFPTNEYDGFFMALIEKPK